MPGPTTTPNEFGDQTTLAASMSAEALSLNAGDLIGRRFRIVRKLGTRLYAATHLRAKHSLSCEVEAEGNVIGVHAVLTESTTGNVLRPLRR